MTLRIPDYGCACVLAYQLCVPLCITLKLEHVVCPLYRKLEDLSVDEFLQSGLDSGGDEDSGDEGSGDEQPKQNGVQKKEAGKTTDTDG